MFSLDNRHKFATPYWANPRIVSAVKADNAGGRDKEAEEDDDGDDDSDDEDGDDGDDDLGELSVEELRRELKKTSAAVKTANDRSARRRSLLKTEREQRSELEKKLAEKPVEKPKADDAKDEPKVDVERIRAEVRAEVNAVSEERLKRVEVRAALRGLVATERLDRALKLIDMSDLSVDKHGDVDGVDEAIEELRADMPELFAKTARRRRSVGGRDEEAPTGGAPRERSNAPKGQSASERQAALLLGR